MTPPSAAIPGADPSTDRLRADLTLGLLHKVNNVLTGIYFNVEEGQELVPPGDRVGSLLAEVNDALRELRRLMDRTVQVNLPPGEDDAKFHDLAQLVSGQMDLVRLLIPKAVPITFEPPAGVVCVRVSERLVRDALLQMAASLRAGGLPPGAGVILRAGVCGSGGAARARIALASEAGPMVAADRASEDLRARLREGRCDLTEEPALYVPLVGPDEPAGEPSHEEGPSLT